MDYPLLNAFWTMLYFFIWILWIFLVIRVIFDIFRSRDLSGWGKAAWLILVIIVPFLGVFIYVIARGGKMHERDVQQANAQDEAFQSYVRDAAGQTSADQLAKLADLHSKGVISDQEFEREKAKILAA
ncbi:MAG: SHOCT domain-containing protein [Dermatophilaceae bacterium]